MVNIVDNSFTFEPNNHRETNRELAKEVCDLRLKLSQAREILNENQAEIFKKNLELTELKAELNDLMVFRRKYNAILDVVMDRNQRESIPHSTTYEIPLALPQPLINTSMSESIRERSIINAQQSNSELERQRNNSLSFDRITEKTEEATSSISDLMEVHDSLDPSEVTSVPPLIPERCIATPSIWKCLDSTPDINAKQINSQHSYNLHNSEEQEKRKDQTTLLSLEPAQIQTYSPIQLFNKSRIRTSNCDMLHSTPVRVEFIQPTHTTIHMSNGADSSGNNQENVQFEDNNNNDNNKQVVKKKRQKQPAVKRKRQPAKAQSTAAKRAIAADNSEPEHRYNLRKRTKA